MPNANRICFAHLSLGIGGLYELPGRSKGRVEPNGASVDKLRIEMRSVEIVTALVELE
jgi:hypothetical protein